uniref:Mediator of RNA polymerase II transcription subunit 15 n=1 Tax=Rhinolophus ferrumequinum TaxID=59479 RepID=A0A671DM65_RHIFE
MDVSGQETNWRSAAFRQKLVSQIEDAMRKAGVAHSNSSKDMESHVFLKAKTRDEYLSLVARPSSYPWAGVRTPRRLGWPGAPSQGLCFAAE